MDTPTNCRDFENALDRELAEGLPGLAQGEREALLDHLESCAGCSALFDLLTAVKSEPLHDEPSEHEMARMRRDVLAQLPAGGAVPRHAAPPAFRWALAAGAALALFGGGLWLGRATANARQAGRAIDLVAAARLSPAELRRAGYRFAAATVEESGADRLHLTFDVARTVELDVDRADPLVTEVLVQSLAAPPDVGSRLRAVASAGERGSRPGSMGPLEPRVRQALVEVMRRDESVGVRLAAQERLATLDRDPAVVDAMLDLLAGDDPVPMRLAAIDYLARNRVEPARLSRALAAGSGAGERALIVHAADYLESLPKGDLR
jgi:hypothetical protein